MRVCRIGWVALIACVGCNQVFGLAETIPEDNDRDDDGLVDVIDNCVDVPNPLQENQDGDALGDACDPCVQGANSDEDGDGLLDGCDNCPHLPNVDQANVDGDDLGDVCDPDNALHHVRVRFDGFAEPLSLEWIPGNADWETAAGSAHAVMDPPNDDFGLWSRSIEVDGASWLIETAITIDDTPGAFAGLYARERIGNPEHACYLERTTVWTLHTINPTQADSQTLATLPPAPIRLRLHRTGSKIECAIPGVATVSLTDNDGRTGAGLYVSTTVPRFQYVEAVSSD